MKGNIKYKTFITPWSLGLVRKKFEATDLDAFDFLNILAVGRKRVLH